VAVRLDTVEDQGGVPQNRRAMAKGAGSE